MYATALDFILGFEKKNNLLNTAIQNLSLIYVWDHSDKSIKFVSLNICTFFYQIYIILMQKRKKSFIMPMNLKGFSKEKKIAVTLTTEKLKYSRC